ncbi:hypothetical protein CGC21_11570 [Leishmania donovani]|uniref:Uncharacterized protein n=1 Tax=Leishmania donovani TaxID=5661 RepID=A0A504X688_LEIDO|nr:hypothetical protein CGC21_11570 [Leishmania donovani]
MVTPRVRVVLAVNCRNARVHLHAKAAAAVVDTPTSADNGDTLEEADLLPLDSTVLRRCTGLRFPAAKREGHLAPLIGRVRFTFQLVGGHRDLVHNGEADKLAKPAMPEAPTPAARVEDLVAGLGRQAVSPETASHDATR